MWLFIKSKMVGWQFLIPACRAAKDRFIVHGLAEEFHVSKLQKLNLECLKDGHKWTASIQSVVNVGNGCPKCKGATLAEQKKNTKAHCISKMC